MSAAIAKHRAHPALDNRGACGSLILVEKKTCDHSDVQLHHCFAFHQTCWLHGRIDSLLTLSAWHLDALYAAAHDIVCIRLRFVCELP